MMVEDQNGRPQIAGKEARKEKNNEIYNEISTKFLFEHNTIFDKYL